MKCGINASIIALPLALLAFAVPAQQSEMQFHQADESYLVRTVPGLVALVLDEERVRSPDDREAFAARVGARSLPNFPPQVLVVEADPSDDAGLTRAARDLGADLGQAVAQTGVLVFIGEADSPFVVTDEIIVQLRESLGDDAIREIAAAHQLEVISQNPFEELQFVLRLDRNDDRTTLEVSNALNALEETAFAHPNFYRAVERRQAPVIPNDTFFGMQWHLHNTGQMGGTSDADIDAPSAWSFTTGNPDVVIAVIDDGFETNHPDLTAGLFVNAGEIPGNGIDDDANGFIDDVNGYDFTACSSSLPCGDADPSPGLGDDHGTAVAGAALARGDNALGVSGSCPDCTFLPVRALNGPVYAHGLAFGYAEATGADVITNSWGYVINTPTTANVEAAINSAATNGRGGLGAVVLFAMNNVAVNDCTGATPDISSIANVIAVSRSTNQDAFNGGGFGACMDVLGPTKGGTIDAVTTDRQDTTGYNSSGATLPGCPTSQPASPPTSNLDYTFCFGGTSFATPVTAGVAGLILSLDDTLTRQEVQRVLQDTTDRTEDSVGAYSEENGFSAPSGAPSHGFGRINAYEATRTVAPAADGGHARVDVFIRDNRLDWGNTAELSNVLMEPTRGFIPHWQSVDIKVDAPPYATAPTTHAQFEAFTHENPLSSSVNRVYVRVRNRGVDASGELRAKLHWAFAGAGLPALPTDFWTAFPADSTDTTVWHPLGVRNVGSVAPSGASLAGGAGDLAAIVQFDFAAPVFDPSQPHPDHYCLFAAIETDADPVVATTLVPDHATPMDNNVTHRNVKLIDSGERFERLVVANPFRYIIETRLIADLPEGWKIGFFGLPLNEWFELEPGATQPVEFALSGEAGREGALVNILQTYRSRETEGQERVLGGTSFEVPAKTQQEPDLRDLKLRPEFLALLKQHQLQAQSFLALVAQELERPGGVQGEARTRLVEQVGAILREQSRMLWTHPGAE